MRSVFVYLLLCAFVLLVALGTERVGSGAGWYAMGALAIINIAFVKTILKK